MRQYQKAFHFLTQFTFPIALAVLLLGTISVSSCSHEEKEDVETMVDSFATDYFNWRFFRLKRYVTEESSPCLRYLSSQVNQEDIDTLRSLPEGAKVEVDEIEYMDDADSATATVTVHNYLKMNFLGEVGTFTEKSSFLIPLKKKHGVWKICLNSPLRERKE